MQHLSTAGREAVSDIAKRYHLTPETVEYMLVAVNNGAGQQAQFNCPELGGSGQWMRGGMTMVGDMFNYGLKQTVNNLCTELSDLLATERVFPEHPPGAPGSRHWWPAGLGTPLSSGSQNNTRYALFANRLAVDVNGQVTVYDTLDHQIGGVSQQQGSNTSLNFTSQHGTISVSSLPVIASETAHTRAADIDFAATRSPTQEHNASRASMPVDEQPPEESEIPHQSDSTQAATEVVTEARLYTANQSTSDTGADVIGLIERLAKLHDAGILSDEEFTNKKKELLERL